MSLGPIAEEGQDTFNEEIGGSENNKNKIGVNQRRQAQKSRLGTTASRQSLLSRGMSRMRMGADRVAEEDQSKLNLVLKKTESNTAQKEGYRAATQDGFFKTRHPNATRMTSETSFSVQGSRDISQSINRTSTGVRKTNRYVITVGPNFKLDYQEIQKILQIHAIGIPIKILFRGSDYKKGSTPGVRGIFHCQNCLQYWEKSGKLPESCDKPAQTATGNLIELNATQAANLVDVIRSSKRFVTSSDLEKILPSLMSGKDSDTLLDSLDGFRYNDEDLLARISLLKNLKELRIFMQEFIPGKSMARIEIFLKTISYLKSSLDKAALLKQLAPNRSQKVISKLLEMILAFQKIKKEVKDFLGKMETMSMNQMQVYLEHNFSESSNEERMAIINSHSKTAEVSNRPEINLQQFLPNKNQDEITTIMTTLGSCKNDQEKQKILEKLAPQDREQLIESLTPTTKDTLAKEELSESLSPYISKDEIERLHPVMAQLKGSKEEKQKVLENFFPNKTDDERKTMLDSITSQLNKDDLNSKLAAIRQAQSIRNKILGITSKTNDPHSQDTNKFKRIGFKGTDGSFYPGFFARDHETQEGALLFKACGRIDDDGCSHSYQENVDCDVTFPNLEQAIDSQQTIQAQSSAESTNSSKPSSTRNSLSSSSGRYKFAFQEGPEFNLASVFETGLWCENGSFLAGVYDDNGNFKAGCCITQDGYVIPGATDQSGQFVPYADYNEEGEIVISSAPLPQTSEDDFRTILSQVSRLPKIPNANQISGSSDSKWTCVKNAENVADPSTITINVLDKSQQHQSHVLSGNNTIYRAGYNMEVGSEDRSQKNYNMDTGGIGRVGQDNNMDIGGQDRNQQVKNTGVDSEGRARQDNNMDLGGREMSVYVGGVLGPDGLLYPYGSYLEDGTFIPGGSPILESLKELQDSTSADESARNFEDKFGIKVQESALADIEQVDESELIKEALESLSVTKLNEDQAKGEEKFPSQPSQEEQRAESRRSERRLDEGARLHSRESSRIFNRKVEGLTKTPSLVLVKEVSSGELAESKKPSKPESSVGLKAINPTVKNRTGKPNTKAGGLADTFMSPQVGDSEVGGLGTTGSQSNMQRESLTRSSFTADRVKSKDALRLQNAASRRSSTFVVESETNIDSSGRPSTNKKQSRLTSATGGERKMPDRRRSSMLNMDHPKASTPATVARQREIEKKTKKEKEGVKAKYQNAAHHSALGGGASDKDQLTLGGSKTSRSTLGSQLSSRQHVPEDENQPQERAPRIRMNTGSVGRKTSSRTMQRRSSSRFKPDLPTVDDVSEQVDSSSKEALLEEAKKKTKLPETCDSDEDEDFDFSDLSFSSDEYEDENFGKKSPFLPFIDKFSVLNFTQNFRFSYFAVPGHVKEHNHKVKAGILKLPEVALVSKSVDKKKVTKKRPKDKNSLMRRIEKLNQMGSG